jgi:hypothetical protein
MMFTERYMGKRKLQISETGYFSDFLSIRIYL